MPTQESQEKSWLFFCLQQSTGLLQPARQYLDHLGRVFVPEKTGDVSVNRTILTGQFTGITIRSVAPVLV